MKCTAALSLIAGLAAAAPFDVVPRQFASSDDLENGNAADCPSAILIFARGSTEPGNLGASVGPALVGGLESQINDLWVQGVGGPYDASLGANALPRGSSPRAIAEGVRLFELANTKCPDSAVLAGGYSQGAALIAASITDVDDTVREQIKGAVLFGYTQNRQNDGSIPDYPADRTEVFCATGDLVCEGTLTVVAPHFTYNDEARGEAADFLASKV